MVVKIVYSEQAQLHIHKAKCYFNLIGKEKDFLDDLFHQENLIWAVLEMYQIKYWRIRISNLHNFRYAIHYVFEKGQVYIYRVFAYGKEYS